MPSPQDDGTFASNMVEVEMQPEEWGVFQDADRDRGDSLLGLAWIPDAPAGW